MLRWALIEAAAGAVRATRNGSPKLHRLYDRLTHGGRTRKNEAKVAVARKLSELVYIVWTKQQPYTETPPPRPGTARATQPTKHARRIVPPGRRRGSAKRETKPSDQPRNSMVRRKRPRVEC